MLLCIGLIRCPYSQISCFDAVTELSTLISKIIWLVYTVSRQTRWSWPLWANLLGLPNSLIILVNISNSKTRYARHHKYVYKKFSSLLPCMWVVENGDVFLPSAALTIIHCFGIYVVNMDTWGNNRRKSYQWKRVWYLYTRAPDNERGLYDKLWKGPVRIMVTSAIGLWMRGGPNYGLHMRRECEG